MNKNDRVSQLRELRWCSVDRANQEVFNVWSRWTMVIRQPFFLRRTGWKLTRCPLRPSTNRCCFWTHFAVVLLSNSKAQVPVLQKEPGCCLVVEGIVDRDSRVPCLWRKLKCPWSFGCLAEMTTKDPFLALVCPSEKLLILGCSEAALLWANLLFVQWVESLPKTTLH